MDTINIDHQFSGISAKDIYDAWIDPEKHASYTNAEYTGDPVVGARFYAYDQYITGVHLVLEHGNRVHQTWRTTEFPDHAEDSILKVTFENIDEGCKLSLHQTNIPAGQGERYKAGWVEHYFEPMETYFAGS